MLSALLLSSTLLSGAGVQVSGAVAVHNCPLRSLVKDALSRLMPVLEVNQPALPGDLLLNIEVQSRTAILRFRNRRGELLMKRTVPVQKELCGSSADVVALITEHYLRDLGWHPQDEVLPTLPGGIRSPLSLSAAALSPTEGAPDFRLGLDLGAAAILELARRRRFAVLAFMRLPFGLWGLRVDGTLSLAPVTVDVTQPKPTTQTIAGQLSMRSSDLQLGLDRCTPGAYGLFCIEGGGGIEWLQGESRGTRLFQTTVTSVLQPIMRSQLRYEHGAGESTLSFWAGVSLLYRPWARGFTVEDAKPKLLSPRWAARVALGFSWQAL